MTYQVGPHGRYRRTETGIIRRQNTNGPYQSAMVHHFQRLSTTYTKHRAMMLTILKYRLKSGELAKWIAAEGAQR